VPLVSAAITTYNRARYLPEAIESVLGQTVSDLEVIVLDDGSTDETESAVAPYRDRIRYVRQANAGRSEARNAAVRLAQGEFVAFCDSDDRWYPDRLARQLEVARDRADIGMIHGQVELIDPAGRTLERETAEHRSVFTAAHRKPVTYAGYAWNCRCLSTTILVRRAVFDEVGLYDPALLLDDYDFYLRVALAHEIVFLDGPPLAQYRLHADQLPTYELAMGQIQTAEKHIALLDGRVDVPDARRAKRNFNLMLARSWRILGDRRASRAAALRALRLGAPQALRFAR
jgi:glycosyltransferase involved in cell wall biosynthesis